MEYLFRGTALSNREEWVYGCYVKQLQSTGNFVSYICTKPSDSRHFVEVLDKSVGIWTGLYDKFGTKIFEGDIVRIPKPKYENLSSWNNTEVVKFDRGGFSPFCVPGWEIVPYSDNCLVIGNKYENPELL